jgi:large subunit ribosomal protein L5
MSENKMEIKQETPTSNSKENLMREIKIEKVVLNVGGVGEDLEKGVKLLKVLSGKKPTKTRSNKRIPTWNIRPGLEVGAVVTLRKGYEELLMKVLAAEEGNLKKKQVSENNFSFGIKDYLEVPGMEYQREIGIMGLDITLVFKRTGRRVKLRKIKKGKVPKRQFISQEEIIKFMEKNYSVQFK